MGFISNRFADKIAGLHLHDSALLSPTNEAIESLNAETNSLKNKTPDEADCPKSETKAAAFSQKRETKPSPSANEIGKKAEDTTPQVHSLDLTSPAKLCTTSTEALGQDTNPNSQLSLEALQQTNLTQREAEAQACCQELGIDYIPDVAVLNLSYLKRCVESKRDCEHCDKVGALQACCIHYAISVVDDHYYESMGRCPKPPRTGHIIGATMKPNDIGLPKHFQGKTFDNFNLTSENQYAFDLCKAWAENYLPGNLGLLLSGPSQTGKTHLISAILTVLLGKKIPCKFTTIATILQTIREGIGHSKQQNISQFVKLLQEIEVLIIDDLVGCPLSPWAKTMINQILSHRISNEKTTLFTTNSTARELTKTLGSTLASRIANSTNIVPLNQNNAACNLEANILDFNN